VQYEPREITDQAKRQLLNTDMLKLALGNAALRIDRALVQNNAMNIFKNAFDTLGEDDHSLIQSSHSSLQVSPKI
jgi:hypothetical protein